MARIELNNLAHQYAPGGDYALQPMQHVWEDGGAYALLGPSGCGKTTLLNIISGLLQPSEGRVMFGDRDVTTLAPEQRNIGQVFQFPVIYDTMSVFDNLAFPLRNRKLGEDYVARRVTHIATMLGLDGVLKRRANNLTADAKQKISLGRGLVREDVAAVLFDEPLTVIDPHLKWQLRRKLREVHEQLNLTLVYVTHDQTEALTFADKVVVMLAGQVLQVGTPQALFERPEHTFVGPVRAPGAYLRRLLHRQPRHELPRLPGRRQPRRCGWRAYSGGPGHGRGGAHRGWFVAARHSAGPDPAGRCG